MSTFAVTGATGFLGGALVRALLAGDADVVAIGRNRQKLAALAEMGARTLAHDLSKGPPADGSPVHAAVHCAALSSAWGRPQDFASANIAGTRAALEYAVDAGAKRFVHISTPSVYFRFCDQRLVPEDHPLPTPVNMYAQTKRIAEELVLSETRLDAVILRPRGLYGAGDTALLPRLLKAARQGPLPLINDGAAETDLTHVDDAVAAILAALRAPGNLPQKVYNVSSGEAIRVRQIADLAAREAGCTIRWRPMPRRLLIAAARGLEAAARLHPRRPEPRLTAYSAGLFAYTQTLDITAARHALGWRPQIAFDEGLRRTFGKT
ncbi:NAD-dependent epimerase/dehydratase family protein [Hyphomonas sp.]|uniref:NAD-dependent epimerase/dehydratase family protein n=1 Tax=Hyphomonas sp. TaxID=87 RepID=UPI0039188E23